MWSLITKQHASHDTLGHVGAIKLYHFLKQLCYFKGMRSKLHEYVRSYHKCQIMNLQKLKFIDLHQDIAQSPQDGPSVDLLGSYNVTSQDNLNVLTAVCNLTSYHLMTTLIRDKKTTSAANHLFTDIMLKFSFLEYYIWTMAQYSNLNLWKAFHSNLV